MRTSKTNSVRTKAMEPLTQEQIRRCLEWEVPIYGTVVRIYGSKTYALIPHVYEERPAIQGESDRTGKLRIRKRGVYLLIAKRVVVRPVIFLNNWVFWHEMWCIKYSQHSKHLYHIPYQFNDRWPGSYENHLKNKEIAATYERMKSKAE